MTSAVRATRRATSSAHGGCSATALKLRNRRFRDAAADYRIAIKDRLNGLVMRETAMTSADLVRLPQFKSPIGAERRMWAFALLALGVGAIGGLAVFRFRRIKLA